MYVLQTDLGIPAQRVIVDYSDGPILEVSISIATATNTPTTTPTPTRAAVLVPTSTATVAPPLVVAAAMPPTPHVVPVSPDGPLSLYLPSMHAAEDQHGLPRGILWAIAMKESGGVHLYGANNFWGYGPGIDFASKDEAINTVAQQFAHWVDVCGSVHTALSMWQSGSCSFDNGYADRVLEFMD